MSFHLLRSCIKIAYICEIDVSFGGVVSIPKCWTRLLKKKRQQMTRLALNVGYSCANANVNFNGLLDI